MSSHDEIISVGILGCGEEAAQTVHIPNLSRLGSWFRITYLYDESPTALSHYATALGGTVKTTRDPEELCASPDVQAVIVAGPDVYHASYALLALKHGKSVFVEKPVALTKKDALALAVAEQESKGSVTVGYTTRLSAALEDAVREIGGKDKILYARLRDSAAPLIPFPPGSDGSAQKFTDFSDEYEQERDRIDWEMTQHSLLEEEHGIHVTMATSRIWRALSGPCSYQLSAMRTVLGMPLRVGDSYSGAASATVLFQYPNFIVSYESTVDAIPPEDADIELHGDQKIIRLRYDRSRKEGVAVQIDIGGHCDGVDAARVIHKEYNDPYVAEMRELRALALGLAPEGSASSITEAIGDLEIKAMVFAYFHRAEGLLKEK